MDLAGESGWDVRATSYLKKGIPILTAMFKRILQEYNNPFVSFANGDILFDHSIIETLQELSAIKDVEQERNLIVGKRQNVNLTQYDLGSGKNMTKLHQAGLRAKEDSGNAQDYCHEADGKVPCAGTRIKVLKRPLPLMYRV